MAALSTIALVAGMLPVGAEQCALGDDWPMRREREPEPESAGSYDGRFCKRCGGRLSDSGGQDACKSGARGCAKPRRKRGAR